MKVVRFRIQEFLLPVTCCFSKSPLKVDFLEICLTTFFGVRNFGSTLAMTLIFFWKCSCVKIVFKIVETNSEKVFCYWDNCIWIGCLKFSRLSREYLSSAVNMLRNIPKTLYSTKRYFVQLNCLQKDKKIW